MKEFIFIEKGVAVTFTSICYQNRMMIYNKLCDIEYDKSTDTEFV